MLKTALLLTCYNRKDKTINCLKSVFEQTSLFDFDIYVVDDGSTDGTANEIKKNFPTVNIISGSGNLYWAGGMRKAWQSAIDTGVDYDFFFLLNDDTVLYTDALKDIISDLASIEQPLFILVGSTIDTVQNKISYGGRFLTKRFDGSSKEVIPNNESLQLCHLGNANIMIVPFKVYEKLGILSSTYTHGIADFDYTLRAKKAGIPSYVASKYLGTCQDDHGKSWSSADKTLRQRIAYMHSIKGLAFKEYLNFVWRHFPYSFPKAWSLLWAKTLFPFIWDKYKK